MREIQLPISVTEARELTVGEQVAISGVLFTMREEVHRHLQDGVKFPSPCEGSFIYHCGPTGKRKGKKWKVESAPPI